MEGEALIHHLELILGPDRRNLYDFKYLDSFDTEYGAITTHTDCQVLLDTESC